MKNLSFFLSCYINRQEKYKKIFGSEPGIEPETLTNEMCCNSRLQNLTSVLPTG